MDEPKSLLQPGVVFPEPDADLARRWLTAVHEVARRQQAHAGVLDEPRADRNFYAVPLRLVGGTVTLVLNSAACLVACCEGHRPFPANSEYRQVPVPKVFEAAGFAVAQPEQMNAPLTDRDMSLLQEEEAEQVRYHHPARVGDVLFNRFD